MSKMILFVATVVKKHICQFHIPYLKWFKEKGYEVHVCAKNDFDENEDVNIPYCDKFFDIGFSRSPFNKANLKAYRQLRQIISENDYLLIHCHTPTAAAVGRLAARNLRNDHNTLVLYTSHGFHFFKGAPKSSRLYYMAEKFLVKYTDGIITINQEDYSAAKQLCQGKSCNVYYVHGMGVDTEMIKNIHVDKAELKKKLGIPPDAFTLLSVSEQNVNKNLKTTLQAFAKINSADTYYLICGAGDMLESYKLLANDLGISNRVKFVGYRYDIFEIVHIADVFLFPSLREGLGIAPIEAMSAGVPLVASDIRGVREYAVNMENSILLDPDDIDGFADAINTLEQNQKLRKEMGQKAIEAVVPFDLKNSVAAMAEIYCGLLGIETEEETVTV